MKSGTKWKRESLEDSHNSSPVISDSSYSDESLDEDDTVGMQFQGSNLRNMLVASAVVAGGIAAYKSGALSGGIKKLVKYAAKYDNEVPDAMHVIKSWSRKNEDMPSNTLLRQFSLKKFVTGKYGKNELADTMTDFKNLGTNISKSRTNLREAKTTYSDTDLLNGIIGSNNVLDELRNTGHSSAVREAKKTFMDQIFDTLDTTKTMKKTTKRMGVHEATISDVFKMQANDKGAMTLFSTNSELNFRDRKDGGSLRLIEDFLRGGGAKEKDLKKANDIFKSNFNKFKNVAIDKNIMMDVKGNVFDMRDTSKSVKGFVRSMSNDFQIPLIGLNPLKMVGLNNFGKQKGLFGVIHGTDIQPNITGLAGRHTVSEVHGNKPLVFAGSNLYKFNKDYTKLNKIKSNMNFTRVFEDSGKTFEGAREINETRKMANLKFDPISSSQEFTKADGFVKNMYGKFSRKLDFGRQEKKIKSFSEEKGLPKWLNPDTYIEGAFRKFHMNVKPYKTTEQMIKSNSKVTPPETFNLFSVWGGQKDVPMYVATNKSRKLTDVFNKESETTLGGFFKQFVGGRSKDGTFNNVTKATTIPFYGLERVNQSIGKLGLALSSDSTGTTLDTLKGLLLKRALPIYMGYQAMEYLGGTKTGRKNEDGRDENIQQFASKGAVKLDLGWHDVKDALGITAFAKQAAKLMPGMDQLAALPVLNKLDLNRTSEEREEYFKTGMDPIRKGRFWALGNTPWSGGKIIYSQANKHRRIMADVKFSEENRGSRDEYYANSALPSLTHPFSPIRHFITDKYHYEMKHYNDRPYLQTAPGLEEIPVIGQALSSTVGQILKPSIKMHKEYWDGSAKERPEYESSGTVTGAPPITNSVSADYNETTNMLSESGKGNAMTADGSAVDLSTASDITTSTSDKGNLLSNLKDSIFGTKEIPNVLVPKKDTGLAMYKTPSGSISVIDQGTNTNEEINEQLKDRSLKRIADVNTRADIDEDNDINEDTENIDDITNSNSLGYKIKEQFNNLSDVSGIYGFGGQQLTVGKQNRSGKVIESSGYEYSANREFWDSNLGGMGGELSEIGRRFIQKKNNNMDYYNPVRNTMPGWMPGKEYFTDFQHGDPYTKIMKGEQRLPGDSYEKLWGIKDPMNFALEAKDIGNTVEGMESHLMKQDIKTDTESTKKEGKQAQVKSRVRSLWKKSGITIDTNGSIEDKENQISGKYDARIFDRTSDTGTATAIVKGITGEEFGNIKGSEMFNKDRQEVNFLMRGTKDQKGYIQYVNLDNNKEQKTMAMEYSKSLWKHTLKNVVATREDLTEKYNNGTYTRGDTYSPIDKLRILADSAPYSQDYQEANATVSMMRLDTAQKEEVKAIRNNMKASKTPLRIYPYRFETADVVYQKVKVKKMLDNNTFVAEGFEQNPIRMAGIHVTQSKSNKLLPQAEKMLHHYIHEGATVTIGIDADKDAQVTKDTMNTIRAVVYKGNTNINRKLLKHGYAKEKEKDWTPAGVRARFSGSQIAFGSAWESISHLDIPILGTKFMQVRSAKESYERREVYGKDFATWNHPVNDFIVPAISSFTHRPTGLFWGALIGSFFGKKGYAKVLTTAIGFSAVAVSKIHAKHTENKTGEKWIPKAVRENRDVNEYFDVLKYVKNKRLYEIYANAALKDDKIDVKEIMKTEKAEGAVNKARADAIKVVKKNIKINPESVKDALAQAKNISAKYYDDNAKSIKEIIHFLNMELNELASNRSSFKSSENATKAFYYHDKSEKTMYGYDTGEPLQNLLTALPKKERDYMKYFMKAPVKERQDIVDMAPKYLKGALQGMWGMKQTPKENLTKFFSKHQLPGVQWKGWKEDTNLDAVKVKIVKHEGKDFSAFNMWQQQVDEANHIGPIDLPNVNFKSNHLDIRSKLMDLLGSSGLTDVSVKTAFTQKDANVNMNIREDQRNNVSGRMNNIQIE